MPPWEAIWPLGAVLGRSWGLLEHLGSHLEASYVGYLEASWRREKDVGPRVAYDRVGLRYAVIPRYAGRCQRYEKLSIAHRGLLAPPPPLRSRRGARRAVRAACRRWLAFRSRRSRRSRSRSASSAGVSCRSRRSPSTRRRARRRIGLGLVGSKSVFRIWPMREQPADDKLVIRHDLPETCCVTKRHT